MKWTFQNISLAFLVLTMVFITGCGEEEEIVEDPLKIIWTMPPDDYHGMPEPLKIQFNHVVEASSMNGAVIISPSLGEIDQERSYWYDGYTYRIVFAKYPEPGVKYTIIVAISVKDIYGNPLPHPYTFSFTYRFGVEDTQPGSGDEDAPLDEDINIDFNYPIDMEACEHAFSISPSVDGGFDPHYRERGSGAELCFVPLEPLLPAIQYTVTIDTSAMASNGEFLSQLYTFTFITAGFRVEYTYPDHNDRSVSPYRDISVGFNYPIDIEACKNAFSISPAVEGKFSLGPYSWRDEDNTRLYFEPFEPLIPSTEYTIIIGEGAKASNGESLTEEYGFTFTTEKFMLEYIDPDDGERNIPPDEYISLEFNYPIDKEACMGAFNISPAVEGSFDIRSWQSDSNTDLYFIPSELLSPSTNYTITIGEGTKASNGESLAEPYTFTFTTEKFMVEDTDPDNGERDVSPSIWRIDITFNCSIDMEACREAFGLFPSVNGELYLQSPEELRFEPSESLLPSTEYTVTIDISARASNGESLAEPYVFSFTTEE